MAPTTYDSVTEEENRRQHSEGHTDEWQPEREFGDIDNFKTLEEYLGDVKSFLSTAPSKFVEGFEGANLPQERQDTVSGVGQLIDALGSQFDSLSGDLENLDQAGLLLDIARSNRILLQSLTTLLEINTEQLSANYDILSSVEPYRQITVSGVNVLENDDEVVPVVPESDEISINTRTLFVKASPKNKGTIAVGDDEIEPNDGWILRPGEHIIIDDDLSAQVLYMSGTNAGDAVQLLGVR